MAVVKVPQLAWHGPRNLALRLPDDWQIEMCTMAGHDHPALAPDRIRDRIINPTVGRPIRELACGKKEAVIVFDDNARVTRIAKIAPYVLEELAAAGIADNHIRFICGLGTHGTLYRGDFIKKLGEDIVARFPVYNHNAFECCEYVGTTKTYETKVYINSEYMKCDFKIVIGACVPHPSAGFGGGGKLVMPGIASFQTIRDSHSVGNALDGLSAPKPGAKPAMGMGIVEGSKFKAEIDESAELAGIDFLINPVLGLWGEAAEIFSGSDFRRVHAEAVKLAIPHYKTPKTSDKDVVICNAYAKANEFNISLVVAFPLVSPVGGDIVITCNAPDGQVTHYNAGLWGKTTFSALYRRMQIPDNVRRVLFYNEYPQGGNNLLEDDPKISYFSRWEDVLTELQRAHGAGTRVAVVPDGTNQYFEW